MKLGIIGAIGVDDIGDVVILEAALKQLKNIGYVRKVIVEFVIFALNEEKAREQIERIGIKADVIPCLGINDLPKEIYNNFNFNEFLEKDLSNLINNETYSNQFKQCDALFFIGGGYFNKYWGDRLILTFILPIALGYQLNKPIFISGVNLGPFLKEQMSNYKELFKRVDTLILRDRTLSVDILEKLGGTKGKLILGADDVLPIWYGDEEYQNRTLYSISNTKYVVLQLHHWVEKYSKNYIKFYKILAHFFNNMINKGYIDKIYFLPFTYFKGVDYECGRRLKTFMDDRDEYIVLNPTNDHIFMRKLISGSEFVITSRYHPVVFGLGEKVPTLGIYVNDLYKQKISGAYDVVKADKENNTMYINDISESKLMEWYKYIKRHDNDKSFYTNSRSKIIDTYAINRKRSIENFFETIQSY